MQIAKCKLQNAEPLTRRERLVVEMKYLDELSLAEIAAVLQVEIGQAGAVLRSAVEKIGRRGNANN